jgi:hypothetical protein
LSHQSLVAASAPGGETRPADHPAARLFLVALAVLLAGYMFLGRGFAHLAVGPIFVGEIVLMLGLACVGWTVVRLRLRPVRSLTLVFLLAFMALGALDTIPYLGTYGRDALRDAVLWGYGLFALMVYVLADRALIERVARLFGRILPVFAIWLPISWNLFRIVSTSIDPTRPGDVVPLLFFKSGDMAVHTAGSLAFLVLVIGLTVGARELLLRGLIVLPLLWTAYSTAAVNRGSLLTTLATLGGLVILAPRSRTWRPVLVGAALLLVVLAPGAIPQLQDCSRTAAPGASAAPRVVEGREVNPCQIIENAGSIVTTSEVGGLEGTKSFRLAWWTAIFDYTVRGPYFWTGKGFGINLADADGFQPTADHSLRAPHNSHLTALARMGVPGFVLWVLLQAAFALGLLRALLGARRAGDRTLAAAAGWLGIYWLAMMIDTSFDPYLEGPQGGIWFWVVIGLGMTVMRLVPRRTET